jgi:hypothetical protein
MFTALNKVGWVLSLEIEIASITVFDGARVSVIAVVFSPGDDDRLFWNWSRSGLRRSRCRCCGKQWCFACGTTETMHADAFETTDEVFANTVLTWTWIAVVD